MSARSKREAETLPAVPSSGSVRPPEPGLFDALTGDFLARYQASGEASTGGMGVLTHLHDLWLDRRVVSKAIRSDHQHSRRVRQRFLREARVQGALQHPGIVPVFDIGISPTGDAYFTMRRVSGLTLAEVLDRLRDGDPEMTERFSSRRLVVALSQVCQVLHYAHAHGVVHRDLKPANIMLGDFGEVYVLDWGIAKVRGEPDEPMGGDGLSRAESGERLTHDGSVLGTPEYMAPEQKGRAEAVDERADVFALGAILFECLTLEALRKGGDAALALAQVDEDPAVRSRLEARPELEPELIDACVAATAVDPEQRTRGADALHAALEGYLEGARDFERRRGEAARLVAKAMAALADASELPGERDKARSEALAELGRALSLDPDCKPALEAVMDVVLAEPETLPTGAREELERAARAQAHETARVVVGLAVVWIGLVALSTVMGVRDWMPFAVISACIAVLVGYNAKVALTGRHQRALRALVVVVTFVAIATLGAFAGPFVVVPAVTILAATAFVFSMRADRALRRLAVACSVASVAVPPLLQLTGLLPPSYSFEHDVVHVLPNAVRFPPTATFVVLWITSTAVVVLCAALVSFGVRRLATTQDAALLQVWRLRHLLPPAAARILARAAQRVSLAEPQATNEPSRRKR
ncbi:MAG: protein kinase [Myxococcales bacterium]|nr:protein kinase [Myxococcales bacterium]